MDFRCTELDVLGELLDETKLNEMIRESTEINKLGTLIKLKSHFIMKGKHKELALNFQPTMELAVINANAEVVRNILLVYSGEEKFQELFCYLKNNIKSETFKNNWDAFVTVFNMGLSLSRDIKNKNIKDIIVNNAVEIFSYLLENNVTRTHHLKEIFVNLAIYPEVNSMIVHLLWRFILKNNNLEVLSALSAFFCDKKGMLTSLINQEDFFTLFEKNLYSGGELDKKHILYFWQRACDVILQEKDSNSLYISFNSDDKKEVSEAWKYFFNLSEISKEKQLYLLEPALPLLHKINILHPLWFGYISNNFLLHPHKMVSIQTLYYLFENNLCHNINIFQRIIKNILLVLNETEYSAYTLKSFACVEQFLIVSDNNMFRIFLENLFETNWAPVPFYFIYETIIRCNIALEIKEIQKLVEITEQLPNKFIRNECILLMENYLLKYLCEDEDITLEQTVNVLKQSEALCNSGYIQTRIYKKFPDHKEYFINHIHNTNNDLKIIVNIFKNSTDIRSYIESRFKDPVFENKFPFSIAVHIMHYFSCFPDIPSLFYYLNFAFENNITTYDINILLLVIKNTPIISKNVNSKLGMELFHKCSYILLNETNTQSNRIVLAFEILLQFYSVNAISENEMELIIERWINLFKNNVMTNSNVCLCFLNLYQKEKISKSVDNVLEFCDFCFSFCEILPYSSYPDLFSYLKIMLEKGGKNYENIFKLVEHYVALVLEINKPLIFEKAMETLLDSLILNNKILLSREFFVNKCVYVLNVLMKESKRIIEIPLSISKILLILSKENSEVLLQFSHVIIELLLYGDLLRKDQIAEYKIYYNSKSEQKQNVFICQRNLVRINAINILQKVLSDRNTRSTFADTLASTLLDEYILYYNKRYFKNSQIHLRKQRILQGLLVILSYVTSEELRLIDTLMKSLCSESNQTSVRFLIQWILIKKMSERHIDIILNKVNGASKTQPSTITGFVFILYFLASKINKEHIWGKIMEEILPWTMGAHFNLRLYTQVVFVKSFEKIKKSKYVSLETKFSCAYESINAVLAQMNKHIDPLELFFLESFSISDHYTLENIFITIPRITQVTETEFSSISSNNFLSSELLPIQNDKKIVFDLPINEDNKKAEVDNAIDSSSLIIQQKITPPWREEVLPNIGDLILIASLVEKVPNLGGLCRTCEIFGVKSLVIKNKDLKNKSEFLSLSMSSENWVDIIEVKMEKLNQYLISLKNSGVAIVGAEQTSKSVQLTDFRFPKRCALLLGNEKQGIPADLLYLLDTCLEIPQVGVIRSLNVHVAASIIVWEYTKQHTLRN